MKGLQHKVEKISNGNLEFVASYQYELKIWLQYILNIYIFSVFKDLKAGLEVI